MFRVNNSGLANWTLNASSQLLQTYPRWNFLQRITKKGLNENISKKTGFSGRRILGSRVWNLRIRAAWKRKIIGPNFQTIMFRLELLIFGGDKLLGSWVYPTLPVNHQYPSRGLIPMNSFRCHLYTLRWFQDLPPREWSHIPPYGGRKTIDSTVKIGKGYVIVPWRVSSLENTIYIWKILDFGVCNFKTPPSFSLHTWRLEKNLSWFTYTSKFHPP